MIVLPKISPTLFQLGPYIAIRWYSLMYLIGYVLGYRIAKSRVRRNLFKVPAESLDSWITHMVVGMLLGARAFYVIFYNWEYYSTNLTEIPQFWLGGLSFHGAAVGMIISGWLHGRKFGISFFSATDTLAIAGGPGLFFGRIGNFINGELYGRETTMPWGMVFPTDAENLARHPSQIYQGLTEGLILWFALNFLQNKWIREKKLRHGMVGGTFLVGYGLLRFLIEFTREPDAQVGYIFGIFSMGQLHCLAMVLGGLYVLIFKVKEQPIIVDAKL